MEWESGEPISSDSSFVEIPEESEVIFQGIRYNDVAMVTRQINQGVDVNVKHTGEPCYLKLPYLYRQIKLSSYTPLHIAVLYSDVKLIDYLLSNGSNINIGDGTNRTPLYLATAIGRLDVIDFLLTKGADPDIQSSSKRTAIMEAICRQDLPGVQRLIESGCNLDLVDIKGSSVLYFAITARGANLNIISALLDAGADVNKTNGKGAPVLMVAVALKQAEIVQLLYNAGADINMKDSSGRTAFHYTAEDNGSRRSTKIRNFLLSHGADPDSPDKKGMTPLQKAVKFGNLRLVERLLKADCDRTYDILTAPKIVYLCGVLPKFKTWLHNELYTPRDLMRLSRSVIRKSLVSANCLVKVDNLDIPKTLQDFILSKYYDEMEL
ncbi:hypothetical protein SNE40_010255 [Patella caerulea]|uniref:SOCS box domain-containing protein n=1 Tax=Patella caerulea TaxID=87958 RepID=A0AAN8Q4G4_PATCE